MKWALLSPWFASVCVCEWRNAYLHVLKCTIITGNITVVTAHHCIYLNARAQHRLALRNMSAHKKGFFCTPYSYCKQVWKVNWHCNRFLFEQFSFHLSLVIPPMLHTCVHLSVIDRGHAVVHCATSWKVPVFIGIFHWRNLSSRTVALVATQPLTEMSTSSILWGVKMANAQCWQRYHLHVPIVLKSGSLKLVEPSGPLQACSGNALPFICYWSCCVA